MRSRPNGTTMVADAVRLMLFPALMAFAASSDLLTMTISNRVSLILAVGFFALAVGSGMDVMDILSHMGAAGAVLGVAFCFFARGWIGGGDAKLAAATALWLGFDHLMPYLVYASLFGGALTLALLRFRLAPLPDMLAKQDWVQRLHRKDGGVPYGIALAAAALAVYPQTQWMTAVGT
jgi:prepilin peptidase CpaA